MSVSFARASRIASSCPKDFDFLFFVYQNEGEYTMWMSPRRIINEIYALPESMFWNALLCVLTMVNIVFISINYESKTEIVMNLKVSYCVDILFNILYFIDIVGRLMNDHYEKVHEKGQLKKMHILWFFLDFLSYSHYIALILQVEHNIYIAIALLCYYERMHRPMGFLWSLLDYHMKGHILFSLLKYFYLFTVLKILASNIVIWGVYKVENWNTTDIYYNDPPNFLATPHSQLFYHTFNLVLQLFCGIGPDEPILSDLFRIWQICLLGTSLLVMGTGVAALAIIMSIHMRPEETFRARFRIIMDEMTTTNVPRALRQKVDTFYRMYWEKQKAVSVTRLLPTYPPSLIFTIRTDIYFEAQQKSRVLRDLSYPFLKEIAKCMETINYVPGDTIVKRNSHKCAMIYIAYGDVEMLTAEDDETPILRFSRGSIINPCGPSIVVSSTIAHVGVRAATFCTAHVLKVTDLWRVAAKYGKHNGQNFILNSSFMEHLEKVKVHYASRSHIPSKYKSTILLLKRNLIELKEARDDKNQLLLSRTNVFLELAGCYIMRNRKGTSFTEQSDVICLRSTFPCILQPMSSLQIAWQLFISAIALGIGIGYPYYYVYTNKAIDYLSFLDYVISFIFILDIVAFLSTGAKIEEGVPITFTHTSMMQVHNVWFIVDFLSVVPIFEFIGTGYYGGMNKLLKLLKVFRMLKRFEEVWVYQANVLRFGSFFLLITLICYIVAAIAQGVLCDAQQFCEITNFGKEPWEKYMNATYENIETRLIYGLYWSISMITRTCNKSNAFTPKYWDLTTMTMCLILFCHNFHFAILAAYSATIMVSEAMTVKYVSCIDTVKGFLSKNNVNVVLMQRFISYLQLCWYTDKAYSINHEKSSILFDLPPHVNQDIMAMQRSKYLLCVPFMKCIHRAELKIISARARLFYTSPNEILLNTGDISNEIYVIKQGFCEILDPITKGVVSLITAKSYFGDLECLLRLPAYYTVRAVTHVQVFSISRKHLLKALEEPKIAETIQYAKEQPEYTKLTKRHDPFLTFEPLPPPPNRELFPLPRKHEPDVAFLLPFNRLGFLSILRYVFPRYTIRPDGKYMKRYERFRAICAFMSAVIFPVYQTLELQWRVFWHITSILDFTAFFDIIQRMLVGYFDEKGILVYHPASTATYYIKGAFLIDLIACLPLESLDSIRTQINTVDKGYRVIGTIQFLMFNRLLQLYRVPHVINDLNRVIKRPDIVYIFKIIPFLMAMLMVMASLIIATSVKQIKLWSGGYQLEEWSDVPVWTNTSGEYMSYRIIENPWTLLLTSVYWATYEVTTTGFNLFFPNMTQLYILVIGMLFGTIMTMYFSVRVISMRANVHESLAEFQENMRDIKTFMKKEKLNKDLQKEVISYYEYMWDKTGGTNYRTVLKMCDQITLRTDAILHIYGQTFSKCPIMKSCEQALLRLIGRAVRSTYVKQDMIIIEYGQVLTELYFIDYGTVEVHVIEDEDDELLTKLPRGSMFGNLDNKASTLCSKRFVANSNMHLLEISSVIFHNIIQDFPTVQVLLKKYRPNNEDYIIGSVVGGQVMSIWKEHAISTPKIVISSAGFLKYLNDHNKALQLYLTIVSLLCVYGDIYNAGFRYNTTVLIAILYTLDFLFVVKIIVNYATMLATEDDSRNVLKGGFGRLYYGGEFGYDIISILPIELIAFATKDPWAIFAFLRLNRVFRMVTVISCLNEYRNKLSTNRLVTSLVMVMIWVSLMLHSAACFWYYISLVEEGEQSWRISTNGTNYCNDDYVCSLYFIITTFSRNSYNGIIPITRFEVILVIIFMIVTTMVHMVYMGEIANILLYQYFRCYSFYAKYLQMHTFLDNNRVSKNLVNLTEKYTLFLWREARGLQVPTFITGAPQCLRQSIMAAAYLKHLQKLRCSCVLLCVLGLSFYLPHPVFMQCEPAFLRHVVGCFQPYYYDRNMYVAREGDKTNSMYFIHKGKVQKVDEDMEHKIQIFRTGQNFGSFQGLNRDSAFTYSYQTVIKSQVLTLCLDDWEDILEHFPLSKSIIYSDKTSDFEKPDPNEMKKSMQNRKSISKKKRLQSLLYGITAAKVFQEEDGQQPPPTEPGKLTDIQPIRSEQQLPRPSEHLSVNPPSALATHQEEGDYPKPHYSRRKSVNILDKAQVDEELRRIGSTPAVPETKPGTSQPPAATTATPTAEAPKWPVNSRRRSSDEMPVYQPTGGAPKKKEEEHKPKPDYNRRKSTLFADQAPAAGPLWPRGRSNEDTPPLVQPGSAPSASKSDKDKEDKEHKDKKHKDKEHKDKEHKDKEHKDPKLPPKPPGPTISTAFTPVPSPIPKLEPLMSMLSSVPLVPSDIRILAASGTSRNIPPDESSIFIPFIEDSMTDEALKKRSVCREMQQGFKPKLKIDSQATHMPQGPVIATSESTKSILEQKVRSSKPASRTMRLPSSSSDDTITRPSHERCRLPKSRALMEPADKPTLADSTSIGALLPAQTPLITILPSPSQQPDFIQRSVSAPSLKTSVSSKKRVTSSSSLNIRSAKSLLLESVSTTPAFSAETSESIRKTSTEIESSTTYNVLDPSDGSVQALFFNKRSLIKQASDATFVIPQGGTVSQTSLSVSNRQMAVTNIYEIKEKTPIEGTKSPPYSEEIEMRQFSYTGESGTERQLKPKYVERTLLEPPDEREVEFDAPSTSSYKSAKIHQPEEAVLEAAKTDELPKSEDLLPKSEDLLPKSEDLLTKSKGSIPKSKESIPTSKESIPKSKETIPKPKESIPKPKESIPKPNESTPKSKESKSLPKWIKRKKQKKDGPSKPEAGKN